MSNLNHGTSVPNFNVSSLETDNFNVSPPNQPPLFNFVNKNKPKRKRVKKVRLVHDLWTNNVEVTFYRGNGSRVYYPSPHSHKMIWELLSMLAMTGKATGIPTHPSVGATWLINEVQND